MFKMNQTNVKPMQEKAKANKSIILLLILVDERMSENDLYFEISMQRNEWTGNAPIFDVYFVDILMHTIGSQQNGTGGKINFREDF